MKRENVVSTKIFGVRAISLGLATLASVQVMTEMPPPMPGAKPITVEHIKVHGTALEGNLEGDCADPRGHRLPVAQLRY